jgi:hypothetical protein
MTNRLVPLPFRVAAFSAMGPSLSEKSVVKTFETEGIIQKKKKSE